jgi:hypothetical protein
MAEIFQTAPGTVTVFGDQRVVPGRIRLSDPAFPEGSVPILIKGADYGQETNHQFQNSMDGSVYLYVFGDRMGNVKIQGMIFPEMCSGGRNGLKELLQFYATNRASVRQDPVIVEAGGDRIRGFLTAVQVLDNGAAGDPSAPMQEYILTISALPQR